VSVPKSNKRCSEIESTWSDAFMFDDVDPDHFVEKYEKES